MHRVRGASGDVLAREPGFSPEISEGPETWLFPRSQPPCAPFPPLSTDLGNPRPKRLNAALASASRSQKEAAGCGRGAAVELWASRPGRPSPPRARPRPLGFTFPRSLQPGALGNPLGCLGRWKQWASAAGLGGRGRNAPRQGGLGRCSGPGAWLFPRNQREGPESWLSPRSQPPCAPLFHLH